MQVSTTNLTRLGKAWKVLFQCCWPPSFFSLEYDTKSSLHCPQSQLVIKTGSIRSNGFCLRANCWRERTRSARLTLVSCGQPISIIGMGSFGIWRCSCDARHACDALLRCMTLMAPGAWPSRCCCCCCLEFRAHHRRLPRSTEKGRGVRKKGSEETGRVWRKV